MAHIEVIEGKEVLAPSKPAKMKMAIEDPKETLERLKELSASAKDTPSENK